MLQIIQDLYGKKLAAPDGDIIGHVKDFYFDDETWAVRYLVVDTGTWLTGRLVLLSPHAFGTLDKNAKVLPVHLTRARIENSPSIDSHLSVSRQYELEYYRYYGWPAYWEGGQIWGMGSFPAVTPTPPPTLVPSDPPEKPADAHLQSTRAITGYRIQTVDGMIGEVKDFLLDSKSWAISGVVADAGHWYSGKEVRIPTGKIDRISFDDSSIFVSLTKEDIQRTGDNEVARPADVFHGAGKTGE
jgi:sporulation protein YlmC with PRC-barrel domain